LSSSHDDDDTDYATVNTQLSMEQKFTETLDRRRRAPALATEELSHTGSEQNIIRFGTRPLGWLG